MKIFRNFRYRRVHVATESRVLVNFARSFGCRRDYSLSMKEMVYVSREGYLQEKLLAEVIAPGFLKQTIYVDINFLLFSPSLLLLLSIMASCLETFELQVMYLCLLTVFNLVPRVSLLCLPQLLEKRRWF